jgi:AcrR family transcriptional regulator
LVQTQEPTGLGRRRVRLSDHETEQRMLAAALAMITETGLTVSLDHIGFEDVIRNAGVVRSAAYRRWPHKDLFLSDLVRELAASPVPTLVSDEVDMISRIVGERLDWLETPELRQALVTELFRQLSVLDFEALYQSPGWRTYLALHATFVSLASGDLRDQVRSALAEAERDHIARVAASWERLTALLGYRLRPDAGATFEALVILLNSTLHGLVILALTMPEISTYRASARPPGATVIGEWSLPALGLTSVATAFLEPDPDVTWDQRRLSAVRKALSSAALSVAAQPGQAGRDGAAGPSAQAVAGSVAGRRAKPS